METLLATARSSVTFVAARTSMRWSIRSLLILTAVISVWLAIGIRLPALAVLITSIVIPCVFLWHVRAPRQGFYKLLLYCGLCVALVPPYFASMGILSFFMAGYTDPETEAMWMWELPVFIPAHWVLESIPDEIESFMSIATYLNGLSTDTGTLTPNLGSEG